MNSLSVVELVRARYDLFSRSEREVADILLASPQLMSGFTATELAEAVTVSKATVTRFIAKLGMESFDEFRRAARIPALRIPGSPLQLMDREVSATQGDLQRLVSQTLTGDQSNLEQTYTELPLNDLAELVELLAGSRNLVFADFRKQYALAYYAATLFHVIRPGVSTLPFLGATAVDGVLDLTEGDLVVMFPFRRPQHDHDVLSRAVVNSGATLATIGDIWPAPANQRAHLHLRCRTESVGVFDSFVTPMSLINLLFTATANRLGGSARDRLEQLEDHHADFQTFSTGRTANNRRGGP